MSTETRIIQSATDTAANWTSNNPTLLAGEVAIESDTQSIKIGDGITAWTSLPYFHNGKTFQQGLNRNGFVDSSCQIAQNPATVNLSTSYQYGTVDQVKMKAGGTVGAGTLIQGTAIGAKLTSAKFAGTTLTGSGLLWAAKHIISFDSINYKNQTCSVQCKIKHDIGSSKNAYIYINKADSANNFSAVTNISTSSAIAVADATEVTIKLEGISMGDCSTGIQMEVKLDTGAITTKNVEITDFQINIGAFCLPFQSEERGVALNNSLMSFERSYNYGTATGAATTYDGARSVKLSSGTNFVSGFEFTNKTQLAPVVTLYSINGTANKISNGAGSDVGTSVSSYLVTNNGAFGCLDGTNPFTVGVFYMYHYVKDIRS